MHKVYLALLALLLALPLALPTATAQPAAASAAAPGPAAAWPAAWNLLATPVVLPTTTTAARQPAVAATPLPGSAQPISPTLAAPTAITPTLAAPRQPVSPTLAAPQAAPRKTPVPPAAPAITRTAIVTVTAASQAAVAAAYGFQAVLEQIYSTVSPSVVHVRIMPKAPSESFDDTEMPDFPFPVVPGQYVPPATSRAIEYPPEVLSEGSGFVWDMEGHIVTNAHVVADEGSRIYVTFLDGVTVPAVVVGSDTLTDLAVLKVDERDVELHPITLGDSTAAHVGQIAIVIGHPLGRRNSMNLGIISGLGRTVDALPEENAPLGAAIEVEPDMIQTDAPVNPGNSGGVLVDLAGHCIGVPSNGEMFGQDINYAVPSSTVRRVVPALIENGTYDHPWIGINTMAITPDFAAAMGLPGTQQGALVMDVAIGSPADLAGVLGSGKRATIDGTDWRIGGDLVVALDGQPVSRPEEIESFLGRQTSVGQAITLTVVRDGELLDLSLEVAARPEPPAPEKVGQVGGQAWLGLNGVTLSAELARAMSLPAETRGVLIESVVTGSPADQAGLRGGYRAHAIAGEWLMIGGDVITAVSNQPLQGLDELVRLVGQMKPGRAVTMTIIRDGKEMTIHVTPAGKPDQTL